MMTDATKSRHSVYYEARCAKCGEVVESDRSADFLDNFFLPNCCPHCGAWMEVTVNSVHRCFVKPKFRISAPRSWFGYWEEFRDGEAD